MLSDEILKPCNVSVFDAFGVPKVAPIVIVFAAVVSTVTAANAVAGIRTSSAYVDTAVHSVWATWASSDEQQSRLAGPKPVTTRYPAPTGVITGWERSHDQHWAYPLIQGKPQTQEKAASHNRLFGVLGGEVGRVVSVRVR